MCSATSNSPTPCSTLALICERYLDAQHEPEHIERLNAALAARNVTGVKRLGYEYLAAAALWWNVLWWEWGALNERDVMIGWGFNFVLFSAIAALAGYLISPFAALAAFLSTHLLTLLIGIGLRRGTASIHRQSTDET